MIDYRAKWNVKKRVVIIVDIICDEDFDCNELLIAQNISSDIILGSPSIYVGCGENDEWEVLNYVFQDDVILSDVI